MENLNQFGSVRPRRLEICVDDNTDFRNKPVTELICRLDEAVEVINLTPEKDASILSRRADWIIALGVDINKRLKAFLENLGRCVITELFDNEFWEYNISERHIKGTPFAKRLRENGLEDYVRNINECFEQMNQLLEVICDKLANLNEDVYNKVYSNYYHQQKALCNVRTVKMKYNAIKIKFGRLNKKKSKALQTYIVAEALKNGVMDPDYRPNNVDIKEVQVQKVIEELPDKYELPDKFDVLCAKIKRYTFWKGIYFSINYDEYGNYLYRCDHKFTPEQRMAVFELDYMLYLVHQDIKMFGEEGQKDSDLQIEENEKDRRVKYAIKQINDEGLIEHLYDYTWLMQLMNEIKDAPKFESPCSYLKYLNRIGIKGLPSVSSIQKENSMMAGKFPNWTFRKKDDDETRRRINVAKRFLKLYRMGM